MSTLTRRAPLSAFAAVSMCDQSTHVMRVCLGNWVSKDPWGAKDYNRRAGSWATGNILTRTVPFVARTNEDDAMRAAKLPDDGSVQHWYTTRTS
ncbi:hypothetical protein PYCCODRAFT_456238 [Trametes coccinea BRFM310]|uniref:Uncharacterized protein n=1 Tax=Trametes coccinea (strain BRFM310) TaxID=1353009 RepID=A0A1Y2IL93_TRAC3|nr:hypothetical protein PYCCODRAFT_456238 [Trametes coccinea BRFM310]